MTLQEAIAAAIALAADYPMALEKLQDASYFLQVEIDRAAQAAQLG